MKDWAYRLALVALLPLGTLLLAYWLLEDWVKGRKIGSY